MKGSGVGAPIVLDAAAMAELTSSRTWTEGDIQILQRGCQTYGADAERMTRDPDYSHFLIFRTLSAVKAKLLRILELAGTEAMSSADGDSQSSAAAMEADPSPSTGAQVPDSDSAPL